MSCSLLSALGMHNYNFDWTGLMIKSKKPSVVMQEYGPDTDTDTRYLAKYGPETVPMLVFQYRCPLHCTALNQD